MDQLSLICPELKRILKPPFAWIDRRFLFNGFFTQLAHDELLLYFFLILVADRDGLSFYNYDKICQYLKLDLDSYIQARNGLIRKKLIAYESPVFQLLALPEGERRHQTKSVPAPSTRQSNYQTIASLFKQLGQ